MGVFKEKKGVVCPDCGSGKTTEVHLCRDHTVSGENFKIWSCGNCSMIFTHPLPPNLDSYYQSPEYISHSNRKETLTDRLYHLSRSIMLGVKERWLQKYSGRRVALLDYGAGTGHFLAFCRNKGYSVCGLEPGEQAREQALKEHNLDLLPLNNWPKDLPFNPQAITLWHVLEHVPDPASLLADFYRILKPGGVLIIAVPNHNSPDAAFFGKFWAAWDVPRHLWHFAPQALITRAQKAGFVLESMHSLALDPWYISLMSARYSKNPLFYIGAPVVALWSMVRGWIDPKKASSPVYVFRKRA